MQIDTQVISRQISAAAERSYTAVCDLTRSAKNWTVAHRKDIALAVVIASVALSVLGVGMVITGALSGATLFTISATTKASASTVAIGMGKLFHGLLLTVTGITCADEASKLRRKL